MKPSLSTSKILYKGLSGFYYITKPLTALVLNLVAHYNLPG